MVRARGRPTILSPVSPAESIQGVPVTCEVCGTPQPPASECVECGMRLNLPAGVEPVGDPPIELLADLEPTILGAVAEIPLETVADFDPTQLPATGAAREEFMADLEPTSTSTFELDTGEEAPPVPDLERTFEPFEKSGAEVDPRGERCIYCGFEQVSGRICNNCGMARSKVLPPLVVAAAPVLRDDELPVVRCRGCAATVPHRLICSECGLPLVPLES